MQWMPVTSEPVDSRSMIAARGLRRSYDIGGGEIHAIDNVSVDVGRGEFVAIMGASGSGKSTFMNIIGCLDLPDAGQLLIDGVDVATLDDRALSEIRNRKMGFVFQQFNLLARATSIENVALPMLYAGIGADERRQRAEAVLVRLSLGERLRNRPAQLSGGQQQRVAIARALVMDPLMILADEPTGALDSRTSHEIMTVLSELNDTGITIVLVTHEENIAAYARRIIRFEDGRVVSDDGRGDRPCSIP